MALFAKNIRKFTMKKLKNDDFAKIVKNSKNPSRGKLTQEPRTITKEQEPRTISKKTKIRTKEN
jgi:hypothetical protein